MGTFRKRPRDIEAVQYAGDNVSEIAEFVGEGITFMLAVGELTIRRPNRADITLLLSDWILRREDGEFESWGHDAFQAEYEPVMTPPSASKP